MSLEYLETLMSFEYSIEVAIANLVENSISVGSKNIWIKFHATDESASNYFISILDDGSGMDTDQIDKAVSLNAKKNHREDYDLGYFGSGLKISTLKFANQISIFSKSRGEFNSRRFLFKDFKSGNWEIYKDFEDDREITKLNNKETGTLILMDKIRENINPHKFSSKKDKHIDFLKHGTKTSRYIGLVFERFIKSGDVKIMFNDTPIIPWSPIYSDDSQKVLPIETIPLVNSQVTIAIHLVPNEETIQEDNIYFSRTYYKSINEHQGIYVYRNNRCIRVGNWNPFDEDPRWRPSRNIDRLRVVIDYDKDCDEIMMINPIKNDLEFNSKLKKRIYNLINEAKKKVVKSRIGNFDPISNANKYPDHKIIVVWHKDEDSNIFRRNMSHPINKNNDELSNKVIDFCHPRNSNHNIKDFLNNSEIENLKNILNDQSSKNDTGSYILEPLNKF